jgi:cardiolipin synthase
MFKARWKKGPLHGRDFSYCTAELRQEKTPPRIPRPRSAWHEITVLGLESWRGYSRRARKRLVPEEPGSGVYVQLMDGERVFVRDSTGRILSLSLKDKPSDADVAARYNAHEFAIQMGRLVESELVSHYPAQTRFLGVYLSFSFAPRFILFDFSRNVCVLLHGPLDADREDEMLPFSSELKILTSLIVESHVFALLKNPVSSVGRLLNTGVQSVARLATPRLPAHDASAPALTGTGGLDLAEWETYLDKTTGTKRDLGSLSLLIDGENFFPLFRRRLEEAGQSVHLRVCIFDNDDVAVGIADLLKRISGEVKVKVLVDRLSTQTSGQAPPTTLPEGFMPPKSMPRYLRRGSRVRVRPFLNPWLSSDHTKVFVIDKRFAYLGGMNIGREYRYEWHDMMVELEGPVVGALDRDFRRAWAHASVLGDLAYAGSAASAPLRPGPRWRDGSRRSIKLRRLYTRTGALQIRRAILEGIRRAERLVYLENPYLYENAVAAALVEARRRGVDVRVVLPLWTDNPGGNSSNYVTANYLLENGVRVYLYPGMTHVKALIVDGWACLGSANFNHLSLRLNQEANVATSDPQTVENLRRDLFEVDFDKSHELQEPIPVGWTDHVVEELMNWF